MFVAAGEAEMYEFSLERARTLGPRVVRVNTSLALTIPRGTGEAKPKGCGGRALSGWSKVA